MPLRIEVDREQLVAFCQKWQIVELSFFGSVLRDDFGPDSDVDVLVAFAPEATPGLADLLRMEEELKAIFGREVDLVLRRAIERSENPIRRRHILGSLETAYVAR